MDTLLTIKACIKGYGAEIVKDHYKQIWNSVKFEVIQPSDESVVDGALEVITSLAECISTTQEVERFSVAVSEEAARQSRDFDTKQCSRGGQLVLASARSSRSICANISGILFPDILKAYHSALTEKRDLGFMYVINSLLTAISIVCKDVYATNDAFSCLRDNNDFLISLYLDKIEPESIIKSIEGNFEDSKIKGIQTTSEHYQIALLGLQSMISIPEFLSQIEISNVFVTILKSTLEESNESKRYVVQNK